MADSIPVQSDDIESMRTEFDLENSVADFDLDLESGAVRSSPRFNALFGYDGGRALSADDFYARVHQDDAPALRALAARTPVADEERFDREFRVVLPDGSVRWVLARGEVLGVAGVPQRLRGACFDVSDRKRSDEAARESEVRYRALTQSSPSAILVACGGRYVYANDAAARLLRAASPRELLGRAVFELLVPDYHELIRLRIQHVLEQRSSLERVRYRWLRLDGSEVDVDVAAAWVPWSGEDAVQIVAHDITTEVLVEEALRESRAQLADELEDARRLHAVSTRLIQAGDTIGIQRALLQEAMHLVRSDFGSVQEADLERHELRLMTHHGFHPQSAQHWLIVRYGSGTTCGHAMKLDDRVVVEDVEMCDFMAGTADLDEFRRSGIRAVQSTPLRARDGTLVGIMSTHWNRPYRPSDRDLRLLDVLARQAADLIALHRAQERLAAEDRRKAFLLELNDCLRHLADARQVKLQAASMLGRHLGAARAGYAEDRGDGETFVVTQHYVAPGVRGAEGVYRYDSYGVDRLRALRAGRTLLGPDGEHASGVPEEVGNAHRALDIAATINVPLVREGRLVALLFIHFSEARVWTAEEIGLAEAVAARTWDAVERARAEAALRESEARMEVVFDTLPVGVALLDTTGRLRLANPEMRRFLPSGRIPSRDEEYAGRWRACAPDGRLLERHEYPGARALRGEEVVPGIEMSYRQDDGREVWTRVAALPTRDSRGRVTGAVAAVMDIDAAKRSADRLQASEESFRTLVETYAQAVWEADADGMQVAGSPSWSAYTGQTRDEMQGAGWANAVHPDDRPYAERVWKDAVRERRSFEAEFRLRCADGGWRWTEVRAIPLLDQNGSVRKWVGMNFDVDARRRAEAEREEARAELALKSRFFEATLASIPDYVHAFDREHRFVYANPALQALFGMSAAQILGKTFADLDYPADLAARLDTQIEAVLQTGDALEDEVYHASPAGVSAFFSYNWGPVRGADGTVELVVGVSRDTTARRALEDQLRASELRYRTLVENARDYAIFMLDANGRVIEWTDGAAAVTGYVAEEVLGRHVSIFYTPVDVERGEPQRELDEAERVGRVEREGWRVCNGGRLIWVNEIATEVRGEDGTLRGFTKISRNLTERRRSEQALAEAARHKDEFLAMLSHELRNPLAPIRNSVYLLQHVESSSDAARRAQGVIERQTQHLARLVDDLLDVTRIARGKIELRKGRVELRELVRRAGDDLRSLLEGRGLRFVVELPDEKVWCEGDATRLNQAIGNLLANAAKFTRKCDSVELALRVGGGNATIKVTDTGIGMEPELLPHLFDPFVQGNRTLSRSEGGLGLGLALVRGIAELHGGSVSAASEGTGRGAEFAMTLPIASDEATRPVARPLSGAFAQRRRVLIVDDNVDAAESLAAIVRLLGHAVDVAHDGPTALDTVRTSLPDVVLCDIGLPRMSGYEVAKVLRHDLEFSGRLIAVSGYAQPEDIRRSAEAGFDGHLAKPFDPDRLDSLIG